MPHTNTLTNARLRGTKDEYQIEKRINSSGLVGDSYEAIRVSDKVRVFVKTPHIPNDKSWSYFYVKERLARTFASLFSEYANFKHLESLDCVAKILDAGVIESSGSDSYPLLLPFLVQEYIDGTNLRTFFDGRSNARRTKSEWVSYASAIAKALAAVHSKLVVHGDIHPENIMVRKLSDTASPSVAIVDFGQAFLANYALSAPEHKDRNPSNYYIPPERREALRWDHTADVYSLGGTLLYLATGKDPDFAVEHPDHTAHVASLIKSNNPKLMEDFPSLASILSKATLNQPSRRYNSVNELLRDIELFSGDSSNLSRGKPPAIKEIPNIRNPVFNLIAQDTVSNANSIIEQISTKQAKFEICGDRETIIAGLLRYLSVLDADDEYFTITTPTFWESNNLGHNGRFLAINEEIARRGAKIKRLFQVTKDDIAPTETLSLWQKITRSHEEVIDRLGAHYNSKEVALSHFDVRFCVVDKSEQHAFTQTEHLPVGLWTKGDSQTAISFGMSPDGDRIRKVIFWEPNRAIAEAVKRDMKRQFEEAVSINKKAAH